MPNSLFWVIHHSPVPWQLALEMTQSTNLLIICSYLYMLTLVVNVFWQGCFISVARNPIWNNIHHVKAAKATWGTTQAVVRYELHFTLAWSPCGQRKRGMCAVMETIATIFHYLLVQLSDMDKYYKQTNKKKLWHAGEDCPTTTPQSQEDKKFLQKPRHPLLSLSKWTETWLGVSTLTV